MAKTALVQVANKDLYKETRDSMDQTLENKFLNNLQWSMLFFCFHQIASRINEDNDLDPGNVEKQFIKNWKKYAHDTIAKSELEAINKILNSPKNIFYSALQNTDEMIESTEIYQEKYNSILNNIEKFFTRAVNSHEDGEDNEH